MGSNWCAVEGCFCGRTGAYFPNPDRGKISEEERQTEIVRLAQWIEFCGQPLDWKPDVRHQFVGWLHFDKSVVKECTRMKGGKEQRLRKLSKDAIPTIETIVDKDGNAIGGPLPEWYQRARESLRKEAIEEEYENRLLAAGNDSPKASTVASSPAMSRNNSEVVFRGGSSTQRSTVMSGGEVSSKPSPRKRVKPSDSPPPSQSMQTTNKYRSGGASNAGKASMVVAPSATNRVSHTSGGGGASSQNNSQAIIFGAKGAVQSSNFILKRLQEEISARKKLEMRVKVVERDVAFFKESSKQFREVVENKQLREKLEEAQLELKLKQDELNRMCEEMQRLTGTTVNRSILTSTSGGGTAITLPAMTLSSAATGNENMLNSADGTQRTLTTIYVPSNGGANAAATLVTGGHVLTNGLGGAANLVPGGGMSGGSVDENQQQQQYGSHSAPSISSTVNPGYFTIGKLS